MRFKVTANTIQKARQRASLQQLQVEHVDDDVYIVTCDKGHRHQVTFEVRQGQLYARCDPQQCPSRVPCRHIGAALPVYELAHLNPGDRVLVNELSGHVWHNFVGQDERYIYTFEVPEGFRPFFVVGCSLASAERIAA